MRKVILFFLFMLTAGMFVACSADEGNDASGSDDMDLVSIQVTKNPLTRSTSTGLETTFASNDAIGVYVLDASGKVLVANVKATYNGSVWNLASKVKFSPFYRYYAYFPYVSSVSGGPAVGSTFSSDKADDVLSGIVAAWTPKADQSTVANFVASDLCIAKGTISNSRVVTFSLSHKMSIVKATVVPSDGEITCSLSTDASYTWTLPAGSNTSTRDFSGYYCSGNDRFLVVKPEVDFSIGNVTYNVPSGMCLDTGLTGNASLTSMTHELRLGDVVYSDGAIAHQGALLSDKTVSGVVVYVSDDSNADNASILEGKTHALVMDVKNLGTGYWGKSGVTESNPPFTTLVTSYATAVADFGGLEKTQYLGGLYNSSVSSEYYEGPYLVKNNVAARPSAATEWFIPSSGQWIALLNQVISAGGGDVISSSKGWNGYSDNNSSAKAIAYNKFLSWCRSLGGAWSGTWFLSASQSSSSNYVYVIISSRGVKLYTESKNYNEYARAFFAF